MESLLLVLTMAALVGSGVVSGLFFTFSNFAMHQLAKSATAQSATEWPRYRERWLPWNLLRGIRGVIAVLLLSYGLYLFSPASA